MSAEKIRVEIVAPVHNRKEITLQCLRSLSRLDQSGLDVHVVIVDDGSTDGTARAIRQEFPSVEVIDGDGSLWFTEGTNAGIRAAQKHDPKYLLLINDDSVFDPDFLRHLVATAERHPRSIIGPLLLLWDEPHVLFQTSPVWDTWRGGWRHWYKQTVWTVPQKAWKVDLIVGNCLLVPAAAVGEAGLMDSKRFPNFGDAEYTPRLRKKGWRLLIEPKARVFCQPNTQFKRVRKLGPLNMINALAIDLKHPHNLRRRFYAHWLGAPNRLAGVAAFIVFLARIPFGRNAETSQWNESQPEPPLSEEFHSAMIDS